jgi:hypothetical protein
VVVVVVRVAGGSVTVVSCVVVVVLVDSGWFDAQELTISAATASTGARIISLFIT